MMARVHGALAFVSMPGLVAVTLGVFVAAAGALALVIGFCLAAASLRRARLRAGAVAFGAAGLVLALAGVAITWFGDETNDGELADAVSPLLALFAVGAAIVAGRLAARAMAPSAPPESLAPKK